MSSTCSQFSNSEATIMSLDPKYANLPWIAHGQPDVYEAGELPEADQYVQDTLQDTVTAKEIETVNLSVSEAHKKFASFNVDASNVDFSDSISGSGKIGYAVETNQYDFLSSESRNQESLLKRFQRLQTETHELIKDIQSISDQSEVNPKEPFPASKMLSCVETLCEKLTEIQSTDLTTVSLDGSDAVGKTLHSKILKQIDEFKPEKPMSRKVDESSHLVYEIYDGKSIIQQTDAEKLADIDRRIHHIETLIGQPDPNRVSALTADTVTHGLLEACSRLSARSSLFQQGHLDMIEARLTSLQTKLQAVTEKREAIADYDMQNKIAELYELVKKWNDVADSLPMIVERLSKLKSLHEEASQFSQSLGNIESSQKNVEANLASYTKLLAELKNNVLKTMEGVKDNFYTIESHFSQEPK
ncbi:unnamed protein product [Trichobilharzia szidati]|nr:unnamed protein product [Trichobilharzia szidati]